MKVDLSLADRKSCQGLVATGALGAGGRRPSLLAISYKAMAARAFESAVKRHSLEYGTMCTLINSPWSLSPVSCPCKVSRIYKTHQLNLLKSRRSQTCKQNTRCLTNLFRHGPPVQQERDILITATLMYIQNHGAIRVRTRSQNAIA